MSGRYEHQNHLTNVCIQGLDGYPSLLMDYFEESAGKQKSTKTTYVNTMKRFVNFCVSSLSMDLDNPKNWERITRRNVKDFFRSISTTTLKDGTVKQLQTDSILNYWKAVRKFFDYLVKEEYLDKSPCPDKDDIEEMFAPQHREHHAVSMDQDEIKLVRAAIAARSKMPKRDDCIFMIGCRFGLRAQALSEIDISDINFAKKTLEATDKGNYTRTIDLDDDTIRLIRECIAERGDIEGTDALFIRNRYGVSSRITKRCIALMIEEMTVGLDKHITPHKMRSTCITLTYQATGDIYAASVKAGHHSVEMTQRYIDRSSQNRQLADKMATIIG